MQHERPVVIATPVVATAVTPVTSALGGARTLETAAFAAGAALGGGCSTTASAGPALEKN